MYHVVGCFHIYAYVQVTISRKHTHTHTVQVQTSVKCQCGIKLKAFTVPPKSDKIKTYSSYRIPLFVPQTGTFLNRVTKDVRALITLSDWPREFNPANISQLQLLPLCSETYSSVAQQDVLLGHSYSSGNQSFL